MKIRYIFLYFLLTLLSVGCYDDKGNNDYRLLNTIEVEPFGEDSYPSAAFGDTIRYHSVLRFASGTGEGMRLTYEWTFAGKRIGEQPDLFWIVDTVAADNVILRVTDEETGLVYSKHKPLRIESPYKSRGWVILTEKNGKSSLNFIREMIVNYVMDELGVSLVLENQVFPDIYKEINGEDLGTGPVAVTEHLSTVAPGAILVLQEGNPGGVDIDGNTFKRDIYLQETFVNQQLPQDFHPVKATWMHWLDVIENQDGRLFTRLKYTDNLFNSGYFITEPVMAGEDEVRGHLLDCDWKAGYTLVHDRGTKEKPQNRLAALFDCKSFWGTSYVGRADILPEPDGGWPANFVPLTDMGEHELIYFRGRADWSTGYFFMIVKTPDGRYLQQTFGLNRADEKLSYISESLAVTEMPAGFDYENSLLYMLVSDTYLVLAQGADLYYYNYQSPEDGIKPYWHFGSPVKGIVAAVGGQPQIGCALENGQLVILNARAMKNRPENMRLYWQTAPDVNLGEVVSLIYKTSSQF